MLFHCFNVLSSRFPECQFRKAGVHIINYSHLVFNWSSSSSFIDLIQYNIILYITLPRMPVDINYLWCIKYINRKKNKKYSTYNHIISTYHNINFKQIFDYLLWFFLWVFRHSRPSLQTNFPPSLSVLFNFSSLYVWFYCLNIFFDTIRKRGLPN